MITEIGALVGIVKGLVDIAKAGSSWGGKPKKETVEAVERLRERVAGIAAQLFQTVALLKTVPVWIRQCDDLLFQPDDLPATELRQQHVLLHRLISESRYDYFSDAFYRTDTTPCPASTNRWRNFEGCWNSSKSITAPCASTSRFRRCTRTGSRCAPAFAI